MGNSRRVRRVSVVGAVLVPVVVVAVWISLPANGAKKGHVVATAAGRQGGAAIDQAAGSAPPTEAIRPAAPVAATGVAPVAPPEPAPTATTAAARPAGGSSNQAHTAPVDSTTTAAPPDTTVILTLPPTTVAVTTAMVSFANFYPGSVHVAVDGHTYDLAPNQIRSAVAMTPAAGGGDTVAVTTAVDPSCAVSQTQRYFSPGKTYQISVVPGTGTCPGGAGNPGFQVIQGLDSTG